MLDFTQPVIWKEPLNGTLTQHGGQYVYLVAQQEQFYVLKFLNDRASLQLQQDFIQELQQYIRFQGQDFCAKFQISAVEQCNHIACPQNIDSAVLVLPYYNSLVKQRLEHIDLNEKLRLFQKICLAVNQLHLLGWIHADLKMQHFCLENGTVKLLDFAQNVQIEDLSLPDTHTATPAYMAPELFCGEKKSIQSDIYALGMVFFELLMGRKPFIANTYQQWALQHCQTDIPLLNLQCAMYQDVLDAMLAKHLKNRFKGIDEIIIALNLSKKV